MNEDKLESILEENTNLKRALHLTKNTLERVQNDYETLKSIHEEHKHQYERLKKEYNENKIRQMKVQSEKKELEEHFEATLKNFKNAIEQKQREVEDVQARMIPSIDQDMIRIKILNEVEIPHRQQLEVKQQEIEKLSELTLELRREVEILLSKTKNQEGDYERQLKESRDRNKIIIQQLQQEIQQLHQQTIENKDKDSIRVLRMEVDELRHIIKSNQEELEDLRVDRDRLRDEKGDSIVKLSKQIESEKIEKRNIKLDYDRIVIKLRGIEDEYKRVQQRCLDLQNRLDQLEYQRDDLEDRISDKDEKIQVLNGRIIELEQILLNKESTSGQILANKLKEESEKLEIEQQKISNLQRENDVLKKQSQDTIDNYKQTVQILQKDIELIKKDYSYLETEKLSLEKKIKKLENDNEELQEENKRNLKNVIPIQKKFNDMYYRTQNQEENDKNRSNTDNYNNSKDEELKKLLNKNNILKKKLQLANTKIMELLNDKLNQVQNVGNIQSGSISNQQGFDPLYSGTYGADYPYQGQGPPPPFGPPLYSGGDQGYNQQRMYEYNQQMPYSNSKMQQQFINDDELEREVNRITSNTTRFMGSHPRINY